MSFGKQWHAKPQSAAGSAAGTFVLEHVHLGLALCNQSLILFGAWGRHCLIVMIL